MTGVLQTFLVTITIILFLLIYLLLNAKHFSKNHEVSPEEERKLRPGILIPALQVNALVLSPSCMLESPEELYKLLTHQALKAPQVILIATKVENLEVKVMS